MWQRLHDHGIGRGALSERFFMKQKSILGLVALALTSAAWSQTYENWTVVQCPPEIPPNIVASTFINHAEFRINFTNFNMGALPVTAPPYRGWSETVNFINDFGAHMSCNTGFNIETFPLSGSGQRAASLYNYGTIDCGTLGTSNVFIIGGFLFNLLGSGEGVKCKVNATNIVSSGTINMGFNSLLTLKGDRIDLSYGNLTMENFGFIGFGEGEILFYRGGFFDGYWGISEPEVNINPTFYYEGVPPYTQPHIVTNRNYAVIEQQLGGGTFNPYLLDVVDQSGSNRTVRAVFLSNTNPAITANVYFPAFSGDPYQLGPDIIEWSWVSTNFVDVITNYLYLEDTFLSDHNFQLLLNGYAGVGYNRPTYIPRNYNFYQGSQFPLGVPAVSTVIPPGTFLTPQRNVTNEWTAYQAIFQPASTIMGEVAGQNVTNLPGRIELTADKYLVLTNAHISSVNYLLLKATNHFGGSAGAEISAPFADLYLRSTNGFLNITNVLAPYLPRPIGICELFSARWTNIIDNITNRYHVLFVDTQLEPSSPLLVQTLSLSATNAATRDDHIVISDVFNVTSNLWLNTRRLTLATNAPGGPTPAGILNYLNPAVLWPSATPRLQYLTNHGGIRAQNLIVFGGSQNSPYTGPDSSTNPYAVFVNTGGITNFGSFIFATNFLNSGTFLATGGTLQLRQARTAVLTNGAFLATGAAGTIRIDADSLLVSNHVLQAGNTLTLSITNSLDDGSLTDGADFVTHPNIWNVGYGINLLTRPARGGLLATTVTNTGLPGAKVPNSWAGLDRGPVAAGFSNNGALGRLILDGLTNTTRFEFTPVTGSNALYVDCLELRNHMTKLDGSGNVANLLFQPGMKIYYAQLIINGVSWAEKLNGKNGGGLNWVPSYAGTYSSTNVVYPDGTTNRLNQALVQSCNLDSDGDGILNCQDPTPVFVPSQVGLTAARAYLPQPAVVLSWNSIPYSTNWVFYKPTLQTAQWQLLTNFVLGSAGGRQQIVQPSALNSSRFYRVRVDAAMP